MADAEARIAAQEGCDRGSNEEDRGDEDGLEEEEEEEEDNNNNKDFSNADSSWPANYLSSG